MLDKINQFTAKKVETYGQQYKSFAIFSIFNYPIAFFILKYFGTENENFVLRIFTVIISLPLLFVEKWPEKIANYVSLYWYFVLMFNIPFFATFLLFENQLSLEWLMNFSLGLFWLVLVVDWLSFIIILLIGSILGFSFFCVFGTSNLFEIAIQDSSTILLASYMYIYAILLGLIFSRNHDLIEKERIKTLKFSAGTIAHEMRTPLSIVTMSSLTIRRTLDSIKKYMPFPSRMSDIENDFISLQATAENLEKVAKRGQNLINVLLMNLTQDLDHLPKTKLSIKDVVTKALEDFIYRSQEKDKVHLTICSDFVIQGNEEVVIHIFFNLLKNSFYFIQAAGKGEIFITILSEYEHNKIIFKDTGPGIESRRLPKLFTPFYSNRPHGTGIGLAFCKRAIESMGGAISVESDFGDHTTFTICLPK